MTVPTFIHIGMGKAGSTSLQAAFRAHAQIRTLTPSEDPVVAFCEGRKLNGISLRGSHRPAKVDVLTDERYSFYTPAAPDGKGQVTSFRWRQLREALADWLFERRPDARILFVRRGDDSLIPSAYAHYVRDGGILAYPAFLTAYRDMFEAMTDVDHLVQLYAARFGQENIVTTTFEKIAADPRGFCSQLAQVMGLDTPLELPPAPRNAAPPFSETVANAFRNRFPDREPDRNWHLGYAGNLKPSVPPAYPQKASQQAGYTLFITLGRTQEESRPQLQLLYFASKYGNSIRRIVYFRDDRNDALDQRLLETALWSCPDAAIFVTGDAPSFLADWSTTPSDSLLPADFDPCGEPMTPGANLVQSILKNKTIVCDTTDADALLDQCLQNDPKSEPFCLVIPPKRYQTSDERLIAEIESWLVSRDLPAVFLSPEGPPSAQPPASSLFPYAPYRGDLELAIRRRALVCFDLDCLDNPIGIADPHSLTLPLASEIRNDLLESCHQELSKLESPRQTKHEATADIQSELKSRLMEWLNPGIDNTVR